MTNAPHFFAACALSGLLITGCGDDSVTPDASIDAAADATSDTGADAARDSGHRPPPPMLTSLTYTPDGCGYEVSTPEVMAAGRDEEVFGTHQPDPDHVHASWAGATESSFAANWHTDLETHASLLLYGTDRAAVEAATGANADVAEAHGHYLTIPPGALGGGPPTTFHEAHVCGLTADTVYYYKVGGVGHFSAVFSFATAPAKGSRVPFAFAVSGDSRNNEENAWPISQHHVLDRGVDFEVFTGDAVFLGSYQPDWDMFFGANDGAFNVQDLLASTPLMAVNGNHENLAVNYFAQLAYPQDAATGEGFDGEEWYSFDYANAHFVMLNDTVVDDTTIAGAEADWLRADLMAARADADIDWVFVAHHKPVYTCGSTHSPDGAVRDAWQPLFDEFEVDVVLTGHNHIYHRSRPIRGLSGTGGIVAAETAEHAPVVSGGVPSGTVYVLSGGAGAPLYDTASDCPFTAVALAQRTYSIVEVDGGTLTLGTYSTMGDALVDQVSWTK